MQTTPIIIDIETCGLPHAAEYLEPVSAAKNLKDPDKIKADLEQRTAERDGKVALDWNVGRIAALAWWTEDDGVIVRLCPEEPDEALALTEFWRVSRHRTIMGFNVKGFDLKFMIQRSRLLGVAHPVLDVGRYSKQGITDLYLDLTFNDSQDTFCMRRTLHAFCRRFGIPVTDTVVGKDIPALVAAGDWQTVQAHVVSDIMLTVELAKRLRYLTATAAAVSVVG
mgnify:CR=1 FL=1